ncbi:hypothetical protein K435DRAFT_838521 [Dendrothele bispora CBS 962.96]|uniref:C3H1-type domain-containing protein n=1 Tax=Dendrothele bispora (strain CBS 962.96) TaxID=1314807 RepID=A0A4S8M6I1_DENBC|nr:hypothetical protein K435DRAFT_838521 [Dendrothele bispora CBS 962.96]
MDFSAQSYTQASAPPCWDFMRGKCEHKNCKFTHPAGVFFSPHRDNRNSPFPAPKPLPLSSVMADEARKDDGVHDEVFAQSFGKDDNDIIPPGVFYKPIAWKTAPCRHFIRTGVCPMGDECNFIHDLSLLEAAKAGKNSQAKPNVPHNNPTMSHCWAYVQGTCRNSSCRYLHPGSIEPYKKYTPCIAWPLCPNGVHCPYKHPEPLGAFADRSTPTTLTPSTLPPVSPLSLSQPAYSPAATAPPIQPMYVSGPGYTPQLPVSPPQPVYPPCVEINGTTYYNPNPFSPSFASPTLPYIASANSFPPLSPISPVSQPYLNTNPPAFNHAAPFVHAGVAGLPPQHSLPLAHYPLTSPASIHTSETARSWRNSRPRQQQFESDTQSTLEQHPTSFAPEQIPKTRSTTTAGDSSMTRSPTSWRNNKSGSETTNVPPANYYSAAKTHKQNVSQTHHDEVYRADPKRKVGHVRRISVQVKN